ncbi:ABC transporter permease [Propionicimonas sp.]|uniref:ABC transporter permease n=1 Tax=Propionicimonas sp. TaxID=1955623 RepID=UPI0039E2F9F3
MSTLTSDRPDPGFRAYADFGRPAWRRILFSRETAIIALLLVVVIAATLRVPKFATPVTLGYLLSDITPLLFIALAMAPVMITGDIDLSVGSMVGLTSVVVGLCSQAGLGIPVAIVVALVVGALGGVVNGLLVTRVGLPALAVTIGTLALYRGIAVGLLGTTAVTQFDKWWTALVKARIGATGIPVVMILFVVLLAAFVVMLHFTPFGRGVFAIGLSKDAAAFSGVNVERTRLVLFVLSGLMSALAGVYYALYYNSARGDNATGLELQVIAAVVLGGVSVWGGRGALHGVVAGVLLIGVLAKALQLVNVTSDVVSIITGVLLVLSVIAGSVVAWAQSRRVRPASAAVKTS